MIPPVLAYALTLTVAYKYILIALGTVIGGPALVLASGFMLRLGYLELIPLVLALAVGELSLDTIWYFIGRRHGENIMRKYGRYFGVTETGLEKIKELSEKHHAWILFAAKALAGLNVTIPILVIAGATKVPFRNYAIANALGEIAALTILLSVGYFFGELYFRVVEGFRIAFLAGVIALSVALLWAIARYARSRILK